ncbi:uncharacterized protein LOC109812758 [Cajanus cajan]|uniref:uncharacterized protein LOC109812758 n=1 Tax=Cajanus cajan TaxID=3821 RepID=UPI00098D8BCA|nr:uncharacterized protein LOC109812758 [Cajanus cajan]
MDVAAGVLGLQADVGLNKVQRKPVHKAYVMGLIATVLLVVAHVMVNLLCACPYIVKTSFYRIARVFYLVSIWVIFGVGLVWLVMGTMANKRSPGPYFSSYRLLHDGGVCCFLHSILCFAYYIFATVNL